MDDKKVVKIKTQKLQRGKPIKKEIDETRFAIKMFMCLVYLMIITILFVCSYRIFEEKKEVVPWSDVETVEDYTYITINKMSEKFAYYQDTNVGIHFVIEKESTGLWHTYLIAINENDYNKYKAIIDYTYERTTTIPKPIKVYGYPVITNDEIKNLAIKNIKNFVPAENEVQITNENYDTYLTNSYLDTTRSKENKFNIILFISLLLLLIVIVLLIATIFNKDKIVDNIDEKLEEDIKVTKKIFKKNRKSRK